MYAILSIGYVNISLQFICVAEDIRVIIFTLLFFNYKII